MTAKILRTILVLCSFYFLQIQAKEKSYFSPQLYEHIWPDFCFEHLSQFPLECSEQHTDEHGNFYRNYSDTPSFVGGI